MEKEDEMGGSVRGGSEEIPLGIDRIKEIIPHREPFLFLDEVIELIPGEMATAKRLIRPEEPQFEGHFPQMAIMPGVLILEALAQTGAVAALTVPENQGKLVLFAGVNQVKWKKPVKPGDMMILTTALARMKLGIGKADAKAYVIAPEQFTWDKKDLACTAELPFAINDWE